MKLEIKLLINMAKSENYEVENRELKGTNIVVTSYQIGEKFYCHVTNEDPGATIARTEGSTRESAVSDAMEKAFERL